jgi:hypothetical protein
MAPEAVFHFRTGSSGERRSHFAVNPTTWALKAFADLRLEARKALLQDSSGMEVRLYLSFSCHYARKLVFQIDGALLGVASNLGGKLPYFRHVGHCMSPKTGATSRSAWTIFEIGSLLGLSGEPRTRERSDHEERRHGYIPARSGHSIMFGLHFAFANELRHCRGKGAADWRKAQPSFMISMIHMRTGTAMARVREPTDVRPGLH